MSEEVKLLPCPFCGGEARVKRYHRFAAVVCCEKCWAEGPDVESEAQAIEGWNSRPTSPLQSAADAPLRDMVAMSTWFEDDRVLQIHFNRPVTDADRKRLVDASNAIADPAPQPATSTVEVEPVAWRYRGGTGAYSGAWYVSATKTFTASECEAGGWEQQALGSISDFEEILSTALEDKKRAVEERDAALEAEPTHWEAYWPGAGSVDSITRMTHIESLANSWRERGAKLTALVPASVLSAALEDKKRAVEEMDQARAVTNCYADEQKAQLADLKLAIARAEKAEAALRDIIGWGNNLLDCANAIVGADTNDSDAAEAFDMFDAARGTWRKHARAALTKERSE